MCIVGYCQNVSFNGLLSLLSNIRHLCRREVREIEEREKRNGREGDGEGEGEGGSEGGREGYREVDGRKGVEKDDQTYINKITT